MTKQLDWQKANSSILARKRGTERVLSSTPERDWWLLNEREIAIPQDSLEDAHLYWPTKSSHFLPANDFLRQNFDDDEECIEYEANNLLALFRREANQGAKMQEKNACREDIFLYLSSRIGTCSLSAWDFFHEPPKWLQDEVDACRGLKRWFYAWGQIRKELVK